MAIIFFMLPSFIVYLVAYSFIINRIFYIINGYSNYRDVKKVSVGLSIFPAILSAMYLFGTIWRQNDRMTKIFFFGPILLAIITGIVSFYLSKYFNNDNSKDQNL